MIAPLLWQLCVGGEPDDRCWADDGRGQGEPCNSLNTNDQGLCPDHDEEIFR